MVSNFFTWIGIRTAQGLDEIFRRTTTAANTANPSATNDYLTDALHSTMALTDATGTIQTTYSYEPYGIYSVYGTASDNIYLYTGREDFGDALRNFRNRYLLTIGSFTSEDPLGFGAGQNVYGYVKGMPTIHVDPLGLGSVTIDNGPTIPIPQIPGSWKCNKDGCTVDGVRINKWCKLKRDKNGDLNLSITVGGQNVYQENISKDAKDAADSATETIQNDTRAGQNNQQYNNATLNQMGDEK